MHRALLLAAALLGLFGETILTSNAKESVIAAPRDLLAAPLEGLNGTFEYIVGGSNAGKKEFPFIAALFSGKDKPGKKASPICAASLIHPLAVLTASHCVGAFTVDAGSWMYIGQADLNGKPNGKKAVAVQVARVIDHPDSAHRTNDIAILILEHPVGLQPVRIETSSDLTAENYHEEVITAGYGQLSEVGPKARQLQKLKVPLNPICDCYQKVDWDHYVSDDVASKTVCFYPPKKKRRVCHGDSGGPMLTGSSFSTFKLRGIVAYGDGCSKQLPDFYTRVSAYAGWINDNVPGGLSSQGGPTADVVGATDSEWKKYPKGARADQLCVKRGWAGGSEISFAPKGFARGAVCLAEEVVAKLTAPQDQLNAISSTNLRLAASRWCHERGFVMGVLTGEQDNLQAKILCLKNNTHAFPVEPLISDLNLLAKNPDKAGLKYAKKYGFRFGLFTGDETSTTRKYYLVGSHSFQWIYQYNTPKDSFVEQQCVAYCPKTCPHASIGNGICDDACNIPLCDFDGGDCASMTPPPTIESSHCAPGCKYDMISDGLCHSACNNAACQFDGLDCVCDPGECPPSWRGDGECDSLCNKPACNFDNGDCVKQCPSTCKRNLLNNGVCDPECNSKRCNFDNGDCVNATCLATPCRMNWLRDLRCDDACNSEACDFDKGDCPSKDNRCNPNVCPHHLRGDGTCDSVCNTADCNFDFGDCGAKCPGSCSNQPFYGDGVCNNVCNIKACDFDRGDCIKNECLNGGCRLRWLQDGECDNECNNAACDFDKGDCSPAPTFQPTGSPTPFKYTDKCKTKKKCPKKSIGNGVCDSNCNNRACNWDGGDCEDTA